MQEKFLGNYRDESAATAGHPVCAGDCKKFGLEILLLRLVKDWPLHST